MEHVRPALPARTWPMWTIVAGAVAMASAALMVLRVTDDGEPLVNPDVAVGGLFVLGAALIFGAALAFRQAAGRILVALAAYAATYWLGWFAIVTWTMATAPVHG